MRLRAIREQDKLITQKFHDSVKKHATYKKKREKEIEVLENYQQTLNKIRELEQLKEDMLQKMEEQKRIQQEERVKEQEEAERKKLNIKERKRRQLERQRVAFEKVNQENERRVKIEMAKEENLNKAKLAEKIRTAKIVELQKQNKGKRRLVINELPNCQVDLTDRYMNTKTRKGQYDTLNAFERACEERKKDFEDRVKYKEEKARELKVRKERGRSAIEKEKKLLNSENDRLREDYYRIEKNLVIVGDNRVKHLEEIQKKKELKQIEIKKKNMKYLPELIKINKLFAHNEAKMFNSLAEKRKAFVSIKDFLLTGTDKHRLLDCSVSDDEEKKSELKPIDFNLTYSNASEVIEHKELKDEEEMIDKHFTFRKEELEANQIEDIPNDIDQSESIGDIDIREYLRQEEKFLEDLRNDRDEVKEYSFDRANMTKPSLTTKKPPVKPITRKKKNEQIVYKETADGTVNIRKYIEKRKEETGESGSKQKKPNLIDVQRIIKENDVSVSSEDEYIENKPKNETIFNKRVIGNNTVKRELIIEERPQERQTEKAKEEERKERLRALRAKRMNYKPTINKKNKR